MYTKVTKHASKMVVKLIWIDYMNNWTDYGLFWLYIYIHEQFSLVYLMPVPMISLFSWFLYCKTCSRVRRVWKLMGTSVRPFAKVLSFVWEKLLFYRVIGLITLLSNCMWNSDAKKEFKLLENVFSSLSVHFRVISMFWRI